MGRQYPLSLENRGYETLNVAALVLALSRVAEAQGIREMTRHVGIARFVYFDHACLTRTVLDGLGADVAGSLLV